MNDFFIARFFEVLLINLPALILIVLCTAMTITLARRHPPAARWMLFAFVWVLITYALALLWHSWLIFLVVPRDRFPQGQIPYLWVLSTMEGLGYVFFLLAVNRARVPYRPADYYDDHVDDDPRRPHDPPPDERITHV